MDKQPDYLSAVLSPTIHFTCSLMYFYTFNLHVPALKAHAGEQKSLVRAEKTGSIVAALLDL